jgi:hypothetical protein
MSSFFYPIFKPGLLVQGLLVCCKPRPLNSYTGAAFFFDGNDAGNGFCHAVGIGDTGFQAFPQVTATVPAEQNLA